MGKARNKPYFSQKTMPFLTKRVTTSASGASPKRPSALKRFFSAPGRIRTLVIVFLSLGAVGVLSLTIFAAWISRDLPDPNTLGSRQIAQSTKIYDRTGTHLLFEVHGDEKRTLVTIDKIPKIMQHATVSIEDKGFYEHHGIYWKGLIRAVGMSVLKFQRLQGTSTLTQQFIKNAVLDNKRSPVRKLKEFILSLQLERAYSKDQILQLYLNEIPYGSTIYGVESAARTFFGKGVQDITLDEAALLAAIPQRPDFFSPYGTGLSGDNRPRLVVRQHYILDLMAEQGYVTKDEAEAAKQVETLKKIIPKKFSNIEAPHFSMYVRNMLENKYGIKQTAEGGYKVITTLDYDKQKAAEEEIKKGVEARGKQYQFTNAALISLDPKNGQILSMVGSKDFFSDEIDGEFNVTLNPRQPGSSFKPIVYAAAFMKGFLPQTILWDVNTTFKTDSTPYEPKNYNLKENGPISMRQALQGSLNIPAVKTLYLVGISRALDFAETLGYTTFKNRSRFGLALVLGGGEVRPIEHAAAFATFANEGTLYPTSAILKIEDPDGNVLEEWQKPAGTQVIEPQIARLMSNVLSDNDARSYIFGARNSLTLPDRPVAAKTGTTNNYHDAWTVGYTPSLVTVVWVGNNDNKEMKRGADSSAVAAPIWQAYMRRATQNTPVERFTPPEPPTTNRGALLGYTTSTTINIDKISGKRATDLTPPEFIEARTYREAHNILYYIDKDDPLGPAPTNPASDPQFGNWEAGVQSWVTRNNWNTSSTPPTEYDDVHVPTNRPQVSILQPSNSQTISSRGFSISPVVSSARPIVRVEARIGGTLLGASAAAPWTIQARVPNTIDTGTHELTIIAFDDVGNNGQTNTSIQLTAERDPGLNLLITSPSASETWSRASFPKTVILNITEPTRYRRLDIKFVGTDGADRLAGSETLPTATEVSIRIPLGPPAGGYQLQVIGFPQDESASTDTTSIPLIITN